MTGIVDTHCHLGHVRHPLPEVLAACEQAGVTRVIDIGMGTAESAQAAQRAVAHPGVVFASVGVHPNDVREFVRDPAATIAALRRLASLQGVVAVGETGLDLYRQRSSADDQEQSFRAHIRLAREADRALVIHCRDAHQRVLQVLDEEGPPERVVMHCFSGDEVYVELCAARGFYCSFAGNLTYKANAPLRAAARAVPAELLLVETDSPYLAPMPHRGQDNVPSYVAITASALADVRGEPHSVLSRTLSLNAARAFGLPAA